MRWELRADNYYLRYAVTLKSRVTATNLCLFSFQYRFFNPWGRGALVSVLLYVYMNRASFRWKWPSEHAAEWDGVTMEREKYVGKKGRIIFQTNKHWHEACTQLVRNSWDRRRSRSAINEPSRLLAGSATGCYVPRRQLPAYLQSIPFVSVNN